MSGGGPKTVSTFMDTTLIISSIKISLTFLGIIDVQHFKIISQFFFFLFFNDQVSKTNQSSHDLCLDLM